MRETFYVVVGKPGKLGRNHKSVHTHLGNLGASPSGYRHTWGVSETTSVRVETSGNLGDIQSHGRHIGKPSQLRVNTFEKKN